MMLGSGHAGGDMGVDKIVPAEQGDQPVAGGKIDPLRPFGFGHIRRHFLHARFCWRHRRLLPYGIFGCLPESVNLLSPASKARMLADSYVVVVPPIIAFSSEVDAGSREENASK